MTLEFLFLRISSTLVHAAKEAASFGFVEGPGTFHKKARGPKASRTLFLRTEATREEKGSARGVQGAW